MSDDPEKESLRARVAELERTLRDVKRDAAYADGELYRAILNAVAGGLVHVGRDGAVRAANPEACRILGLSFDELTQRYTYQFETQTLWEDGTPCSAADYPVTRALATGEAQPPAIIGVRRPDRHTSWAIFTALPVRDPNQGELTGAVVTFVDITERRRIEASLRESEAKLRSILNSAPNVIILADRAGVIQFINRTEPDTRVDEALGRSMWDFVAEHHRVRGQTAMAKAIQTRQVTSYECESTTGRSYSVHLAPFGSGEEIQGVTCIAWDVTEQRRLEAHVKMADRMAAIGTLAASVAHEINNPLTYVIGNLFRVRQQLKTGLSDRPLVEQCLDDASEGAQRIQAVVRDLSTFSHLDDERSGAIDLRQLLESSLRMAKNHWRHRARIVRDYGAVPPVFGTESRLGQVFLNLIVNAAQACPDGRAQEHEIRLRTRLEDDRVVVEVEDTGEGIPAEMLDRIFEPFVTTRSPGIGTGLGLYICRNILEMVGGTISVTSVRGQGSCFRVSLPKAPERPSTPASQQRSEPPASPRALRVLVVDDEPSILRVLSQILSEHQVTTAGSGRQALEALATQSFDLVLCDLVMPELTGVDVYEYICSEGLDVDLVVMTGGAFTESTRQFLESTELPLVRKPFTGKDIERVVAECVERRGGAGAG